MSLTGLDSIDRTVHKTNEWLADVAQDLGTRDRKDAFRALRAVLHALRDQLPIAAVVGLGAQLPLLLRGLYYEGWHPHVDGKTSPVRNVEEFLAHVEQEFSPGVRLDSETAVRAVLGVMDRHLDPNETQKIARLVPVRIRELWGPPVEPRDS